jgi:hypothetical protein
VGLPNDVHCNLHRRCFLWVQLGSNHSSHPCYEYFLSIIFRAGTCEPVLITAAYGFSKLKEWHLEWAVVVDVEHLDGSAVVAQYHDQEGKRRWVKHAYSNIPFDDVPMSNRSEQLRQVRFSHFLFSANSIL